MITLDGLLITLMREREFVTKLFMLSTFSVLALNRLVHFAQNLKVLTLTWVGIWTYMYRYRSYVTLYAPTAWNAFRP